MPCSGTRSRREHVTEKHADDSQDIEKKLQKPPKDKDKDLELPDEAAEDVRGGKGPDKPPERFYIK
jgi:hypothetical protein